MENPGDLALPRTACNTGAMEPLHAVLAARRQDIIDRWKAMVQGTLVSESMSTVELVDHLPSFLNEVIAALRSDHLAGVAGTSEPDESQTAADHGGQRLRLGFSLDAVVREYGALRDAIVDSARAAGAQISFRELEIIFRSIVGGIAGAVSEYSRQRDAEQQRLHNEHFAFIAHELRNPLFSAKAAVEVLKQTGAISAEARAAGTLERSLHRMQDLIDHSLNIARIASGIEVHREPVSLKALLEESALTIAFEAEAKRIALNVRVDEDKDVYLDLRLVRSALNNLVRNAVKYSHPDGHVEVRAIIAETRTCIEVEDSCGGLPPGDVLEAFAPFVRLNTTETGFGLGLAIAKQAVDAHGGTLRVQNLPGKGCIFVLELPVASISHESPASRDAPDG